MRGNSWVLRGEGGMEEGEKEWEKERKRDEGAEGERYLQSVEIAEREMKGTGESSET